MRTKRALYNTITSLLLQVVTAICGLIVPSLIIKTYGSAANGAVSSISKFLGYVSLLEAGVGGVTRAALYGPLANKNTEKISAIINATEKFFRKIAVVFIIYSLVLAGIYPLITNSELGWCDTAILVIILAGSSFAQYFFGITYGVLLNADQGQYIVNIIQSLTLVINAVLTIVFIELNFSFHLVKLLTTSIYVIRPILLGIVVRKKYKLLKNVAPDNEAIKNRWNGFGQHIAYFLHNNVDVFLVSIVLGLKAVSVYAVYHFVTNSIRNIINACSGSTEAAFGNMIARKEQDNLTKSFSMIETLNMLVSVCMFSTTLVLVFDFVPIYTNGVTDINYLNYAFGILIVVSEFSHCVRGIYHNIVLAAGHYKQTQIGAFVEAGLNVVLSLILIFIIGVSGVVLATIFATIYRIATYLIHLKKNILYRKPIVAIKKIIVSIIAFLCVVVLCYFVPLGTPTNYFDFFAKSLVVFAIACVLGFVIVSIFYFNDIKLLCSKLSFILHRKKK